MESWQEPQAIAAASALTLEPVASGLSSPIYITNADDGTNRLFIVEQTGAIKVLQPGSSTPTIFLNISSKIVSGGEQGLLGLAFHPQFSTNRRFFVNYTRAGDGATVVAEYRASASNPNVADATEIPIITIAQPFANHNGGMIEFGADGFLYIASGDGGSGNDPDNRAQNRNELLGKILRIDINTPNGALAYSSPASNPFFGSAPGRDEIYALGLRNPWRFSFDRTTNRLFVGDVGQGASEEIDIITLGGNYGWRVYEGTLCTNLDPALCNPNNFTAPIAEYSHTSGRCSITGGYVYRGTLSAVPVGAYVYADFCTGEIFLLENGGQTLLVDTDLNISSFGEDEAREIYVVNIGGEVFRLSNQAAPNGTNTVGLFNRASSRFFLKNTNSAGTADRIFDYGTAGAGWTAIAGDWNGDEIDTAALFNPTTSFFHLKNTHTGGAGDRVFSFGPAGAGWAAIAGDWDGDGVDTVGLFDPTTSRFFLKNSHTSGQADLAFQYGPSGSGWTPVVGDWDGDGTDTVGLFNPATSTFFLKNSNSAGPADLIFAYGPAVSMWFPVAGDWNGDGVDTIGLFDPAMSVFYLRNTNSAGAADFSFSYGPAGAGWLPITGDWDGL
jgi:hypothetical protein